MNDKEQVIDCFEEQLKNALNNTSDSCISINHHREIWELILKAIQDTKQALTTKSKKEQALEIIVKKNVDIYSIKVCINAEHYNVVIKSKNFNNKYSYEIWYNLTQEEFDLLKEVIKNED